MLRNLNSIIRQSRIRLNQAQLHHRSFATVDPKIMRNIGISAHIDSGKTTLTERILYYTGRIKSIHEVRGSDNIGAKMDSMELEREKGITIQSAATHCKWKNCHINIIDTPGHVDFTIEVERALRVLDGAIMLICGASGVQPQTLTVDRQMKRYNIPRIVFINKLDRMGADPWAALVAMRDRLGLNVAAIQIPIGLENGHKGVVDIINKRAYYFEGDHGENILEGEVPTELLPQCEEKYLELIGSLADVDDQIADMFLNEEEISSDILKEAIRRNTITQRFVPVLMGSAYKNKGVQLCMDAVIDYLPDPSEVVNEAYLKEYGENARGKKLEKLILEMSDRKPFVALAFKLEENKFGQLTYMRIYQGKLRKGDIVLNTGTGKKVRISRMVRMHAAEMEELSEAGAGDIMGIFGIECASGETFTGGQGVTMQNMHVPAAVISQSISPTHKDDIDTFMKALNKFEREDPTFTTKMNDESEELIISGMGELHLQIYTERIKREFNVDVKVGDPSVNFRETIAARANFNYLHKKQTGGSGQYAKVIGYIEPIPDEEYLSDYNKLYGETRQTEEIGCDERLCKFREETKGLNIPFEYIPPIEKAFHEATIRGPQTGYGIVGCRFVLTDGQTHTVDSSGHAFATATKRAFQEAYDKAGPLILEPIMSVEVNVPLDFQATIMGQLVKRRGTITGQMITPSSFTLSASVPLRSMFGYATELRGSTQGQGEFSMEYLTHQPVATWEIQDIVEKYKQKLKEASEARMQ